MTQVKYFTFLAGLALLQFSGRASAQNGYREFSLGGGLSTSGSGLLSIGAATSPNGYLKYGLGMEVLGYNNYGRAFTLQFHRAVISAGASMAYRLPAGKNFSMEVGLGANAGSDNHRFIWYPRLGLEPVWSVSPCYKIFGGMQVLYLFGLGDRQWQPFINTGIKIRL